MRLARRQLLRVAAGAAAMSAIPPTAYAETYPTRPVKLIVGFPSGGPTDLLARLLAQLLSQRLGQQFVVETRVGAAGNLAAKAVVHAPPDGYTLLLATTVNATHAALFDDLRFDLIRDTEPVAGLQRTPAVLLVNPSSAIADLPAFIDEANKHPGKIAYASDGTASLSYLYGELFKTLSGVDLTHRPHRGTGSALDDVLSGHVPAIFAGMTAAAAHIRAGRLRPLGVTTAERRDIFPRIPSIGEFVPGYDASAWTGVVAPGNTPGPIIDRLNEAVNVSLADTRMVALVADLGAEPLPMDPAQFGTFMADEAHKWGNVVRMAGIRPE